VLLEGADAMQDLRALIAKALADNPELEIID